MDDRYPSTDEHQAVALDLPAKQGLNRSLPLVKSLLAIPHYILLVFRSVAAVVAVIIAWFAILFTGRYSSIVELAPGELGASPFGGTATRSSLFGSLLFTCVPAKARGLIFAALATSVGERLSDSPDDRRGATSRPRIARPGALWQVAEEGALADVVADERLVGRLPGALRERLSPLERALAAFEAVGREVGLLAVAG